MVCPAGMLRECVGALEVPKRSHSVYTLCKTMARTTDSWVPAKVSLSSPDSV